MTFNAATKFSHTTFFRNVHDGEELRTWYLKPFILSILEGRGLHMVLVGKPERKKPLGRPRRRWEDNIKMNLQEVGGGCEDWM